MEKQLNQIKRINDKVSQLIIDVELLIDKFDHSELNNSVVSKGFSFNMNFSVSTCPEEALVDIGNQILDQNPKIKTLYNSLVTFVQQTFDGKSFLEILSVFTDIIGFIPGPIGFIAGLAGTAIGIAIYAEKVKNGTASELDHLDLVMGCMGCMMSCVPGGRAVKKIVDNTSKIAVKGLQKTKIVQKTIKLANGGANAFRTLTVNGPSISISHLSAIKKAVGFAKTSIEQSQKYKDNIGSIVELYGQLCAVENILSPIPINSTDSSEGTESLSISRQSLIDVISNMSKITKKIDTIGELRQDDFSSIMILQYGTATINNNIFIDNQTYEFNGTVNSIKINPYTKLIINNRTDFTYINNTKLDVLIYDCNLQNNKYIFNVVSLEDNLVKNIYDTTVNCAVRVKRPDGQFSQLVIGECADLDMLNIFDQKIALYDRGCMIHEKSRIDNLYIGPNANVTLLKKEPRFAKASDLICAWSNNTGKEMEITNIREIINIKANEVNNVYLCICKNEPKSYIYGNYVRLMCQDTNLRWLHISEFIVRSSGVQINGKFEFSSHNKKIKPFSTSASSIYYLGFEADKINDGNYDTLTCTGGINGEVMPWIEQDVSDNGLYSKCINSIYIVNRKDICKERIINSRVAIFDKYRYLVWMSDNIDYVSDEYFFPKNNELVFDLIKINSDVTNLSDINKKCNYIYGIAVYDLYENFVWTIDKNNTILVYEKNLYGILNNNNINTGVAYCAIPPKIANFYKKIRISSLNSLKNTTIELYKYNDNIFVKQFIASNLDNTNQNFIMPNVTNILESKLLKKMSIQITDKHCLPMFDGKYIYDINLWNT